MRSIDIHAHTTSHGFIRAMHAGQDWRGLFVISVTGDADLIQRREHPATHTI